MASAREGSFQWRYALAWPLAATVLGGLSVWRFMNLVLDGRSDGWTVVVGVFGSVLIMVVLLAIPAIRSGRRVHYLRRETPDAFVCTAAVYPEAAQQLAAFAEVGGGSTHRLWANIWAELWCDGVELRVYGGTAFGLGGRPKVLARIPLPPDWSASISRAQQGPYVMNTLQISAAYGETQMAVNLLPNWSAGVVLLPYYRAARMEPFAEQLNALPGRRREDDAMAGCSPTGSA